MQKKQQKKNQTRTGKPRTTATDRKIHQQQIGMAIVGILLILAMVIALIANY